MMVGSRTLVLLAVFALAGCGGSPEVDQATTSSLTSGQSSTTPTSAPPTTLPPDTTTTTPGDADTTRPETALGEIPPRCRKPLVDLLVAMEPHLEGFTFEQTFEDDLFPADELAEIGEQYETAIADLDCPEMDNEPAFRMIISLAELEAPGTVAYLEWIADQAAMQDEIAGVECEDLLTEADQVLGSVDTIEDLEPDDVILASQLITAITTNCPEDVVVEFFERFDL